MSGFYKKAVVWLGLDEQYPENGTDADLDLDELEAPRRENGSRPGVTSAMDSQHLDADTNSPAPSRAADRQASSTVRAVPLDETAAPRVASRSASSSSSGSSSGTVRAVPLAVTAEPETVVPTSFNNAQDVADVYKRAKPVVVDLTNAERDLARRLIDFSAGLCYGLGGQMEKLERDRYLLTPEGVELSSADRRALEG